MAAAVQTAKVKKYPAYTVTTTGKVFSTWRSEEPVELTPQPDRDGRPFVGMFNELSDGKAFHASIARLVLEAFVRPGKAGECAAYRDFDPKNVRKSNLYWSTRSAEAKRKSKKAKAAAARAAAPVAVKMPTRGKKKVAVSRKVNRAA